MSRRTATALLLTRGEGSELAVYLAERAPELRFFGGYWALPGGTVGPEDLAAGGGDEAALQACAHRELFEELGLVRHRLPPARTGGDALGALREQLLAHEALDKTTRGPSPWPGVIAGASAPRALRELCRIETPPFAPVRYDTTFFHVPLDECTAGTAGPRPDVWPGELVQGRWWLPSQALASWRNGDLYLVPPVVILLEHLVAANGDLARFAAEVAATARGYANGRLHQVRFSPGVVLAPLRTPTLPPATTTNCYVVGHRQLWVVDPGSPHFDEQQRLVHLLEELTRSGATVEGILVTHHHPDHVGGVAALSRALDLPVRAHPLTLERLPPGSRLGAPLHDGDTVPLGESPDSRAGWTLRAILTPGHDRGHLCFAESRYGTALVGDMLSTISTIIVDPPEGHLATYLRSLERLALEPMTTLYPAHGPAVRDGQKLVKQYLRHRRQRETKLLEVLQQGPATAAELLPKVYWDADPSLYRFAARSLLAGLQKLQEDGRAHERDGRWHAVAATAG
jgi:ribonuclease/clavin/mitogillin